MKRWILNAILAAIVCMALVPAQGRQPINDVGSAAVAGPAASLTQSPAESQTDSPDPFPIRRVFVPKDRLEVAIAQAGPGGLVRMPRSRFEDKVRTASIAQIAINDPPQIVEAKYSATWNAMGLSGTAEWKLTYPSSQGGLVGLDGLRVAVGNPKWPDQRPAVLFRGIGEKGAIKLLADSPKDEVLTLQWSCRSIEEPTAEKYEIGLPACSLSELTLDLPADREVSALQAGVMLTGPLPAGPGNKRWLLNFGGQSRLELTVRRPGHESQPSAQIRSVRTSRHDISPNEVASKFEFELEAVRGAMSDLAFEADPSLRIAQVLCDSPLNWRADPSIKGGLTKIKATLPEQAVSVKVAILATSAIVNGRSHSWTCPRIRLLGCLPAGDAIEVRTDSELTYNGCDPGDYRVADAGDEGQGYRLGFVGSFPAEVGIDRRQPTIRLLSSTPEYTSNEQISWRIGDPICSLTVRSRIKVIRGPLASLEFTPPIGYTPTIATLLPEDSGVSLESGSNGRWIIESSRPFPAGSSFDVVIEMRGPTVPAPDDPASRAHQSQTIAIPRLILKGATERDGLYRIEVDPRYTAQTCPLDLKLTGIPFRGHEPDGTITLAIRPVAASVASDTVVSLDQSGIIASTTLRIRPVLGALGSVTIWAPALHNSKWAWTTPPGTSIEALPATAAIPWTFMTAATVPWHCLAYAPVCNETPVNGWRLQYHRPPTAVTAITGVWRQSRSDASSAAISIPIILGSTPTATGVQLDPAASAEFYTPVPIKGGNYGSHPVPLIARDAKFDIQPAVTGRWEIVDIAIDSHIEDSGQMLCRCSGHIRAADGPLLRFSLLPDATLIECRFAGCGVSPSRLPIDSKSAYAIQMPEHSPRGLSFEISYRLPRPSPYGLLTYHSLAPEFPIQPTSVSHSWSCDTGFVILWAEVLPGNRPNFATVVSTRLLALLSAIMTSIIAMIAMSANAYRSQRMAYALLLLVGLVGYCAWIWSSVLAQVATLPLAAGLMAIGAYLCPPLRSRRRLPASQQSTHLTALSVGCIAVALVMTNLGDVLAQSPAPHSALITPSPTDVNQLDVYVHPATLKALDDFPRSQPDGPVITSAEYDGVVRGTALFDCKYTVWSPNSGNDTLCLPLSSVRIKAVTVDGKPAFPESDTKSRYVVGVHGSGFHTVRMQFEVPVTISGADSEVIFGIPDVPTTRVDFVSPSGSDFLDVASRSGEQRLTTANGCPRISADHGGGRTIAIRWRSESTKVVSSVISVREATVWDLRESGSTATSAFFFRSDAGSITRLRFDIPDDLEPAKLTVRPADGRTGSVGLKSWQLGPTSGGWQPLDFVLQGPVDGSVIVSMRLHPKRSLTRRPTLRCPRTKGAIQGSVYCAVRASGLILDDLARTGFDDYPPEGFVKEFSSAHELALDRFPPTRVFRNASESNPTIRPVLRPAGVGVAHAIRSVWTVGTRAEVETVCSIAARDFPISYVEWDLQGAVKVMELRSPILAGWFQDGSRLQAWFRKPTSKAIEVRWRGTLNGYQRSGRPGSEPGTVELPNVKLVGPEPTTTDFSVRSTDGWAFALDLVNGLKSIGNGRYSLDATLVPAVRATATPPNPPSTIDSIVEIARSPSGAIYRSVLSIPIRPNRAASFAIRLTGAFSPQSELRAPRGVSVGSPITVSDGVFWPVSVLMLDATHIELHLSLPLSGTQDFVLPQLAIWFGPTPVIPTVRPLLLEPGMVPVSTLGGWTLSGDASRASLLSRRPLVRERSSHAMVWESSEVGGTITIRDLPPRQLSPHDPRLPIPEHSPPPIGTSHPSGKPGLSWLTGLVWILGLLIVGWLSAWGHPGWWPERLAGSGLLGLAIIGLSSAVGIVFATMILIGWAFRCWWSLRHLVRVVARRPLQSA